MDMPKIYTQDNSDVESQKLNAAKNLYRSGDYAGALNIYLDLSSASFSHKLYHEIGRCYYRLNDIESAEKNLLQSIKLESKKNPAYYLLGNLYKKQNDINHAIEYWMGAYAYRPDDTAATLNLATSYSSKNMKPESMHFYEKYLMYSKDKTTDEYLGIKDMLDTYVKTRADLYKRAKIEINSNRLSEAREILEYSQEQVPADFNTYYLLGKLCAQEKDYTKALKYLLQAHCADFRSLDVLQMMYSVMSSLRNNTGSYCCLKRMIPLVVNNQKTYLDIMRATRQLEGTFSPDIYQEHYERAEDYYRDNHYKLALYEYENSILINGKIAPNFDSKIQRLKYFFNPEERIIKSCMEKGTSNYSLGNYNTSNKYFTRIMSLTTSDSKDYKFAKSRLVNV